MMRALFVSLLMLSAGAPMQALAQDRVAEVRAMCVDARGAPHPAAQTFGERESPADFEGELFRCLAGTQMRYDVDRAALACRAGEALWLAEGALTCRRAAEHPLEHDRDLLRRFGAGVKVVRLAAPEPAPPRQPAYPRYP